MYTSSNKELAYPNFQTIITSFHLEYDKVHLIVQIQTRTGKVNKLMVAKGVPE